MENNCGLDIAATEIADELLSSLCRGLSDENKFARKNSLLKIRSSLEEKPAEELPRAVEVVFKDVLRSFNDPSEACREQAVLMLTKFLFEVPNIDSYLTFVITVLAKRISLDANREPSEEIRLLLFKFLKELLRRAQGNNLLPHLDDLNKILCNGMLDAFPDVKLISAECTRILATSIPKHFHVQSESYVKALLPGAVHKHSKVRIAFISTIACVVKHGTHNLVEKVAQVLGERLYDSSPVVRKEVVNTGGDWLVTLPDRYSQFCRIIPLVVTGLNDEMPDVQEAAQFMWDRAGLQYELENEKELKDEIDFGLKNLPGYPLKEERPRVGCRFLMQRESCKMVPAILKELHDWNAGVQMQAASLLYQLVRHLEAKNIQLLQRLWPDLCLKIADSSNPCLNEKIEQTVMMLGYFAPVDAIMPIAISQEELTKSQLYCLSAVLKGMSSLEEPFLFKVCSALAKSNNTNMEVSYQFALLDCATQTLETFQRKECNGGKINMESSFALFSVLLNLVGNSQSTELSNSSKDILDQLALLSGHNKARLFEVHGPTILSQIPSTVPVWTEHCAYKNIFAAFVRHSGVGIGPVLPIVAEILVSWAKIASTGADLADMLRISMPVVSWTFLLSCNVDPEPFLKTIIFDAIQPNLKWSAGRLAEARRSQALVLLTIIISEPDVSDSLIASLIPSFPPLLTAMLEETSKDPRLGAGRVLEILCKRWRKLGILDLEYTFKIVKVAAERLDDVKAEVRLQALQVLRAALPDKIPDSYSSHMEHLYKTILIHLDDQDKTYSAAVLETLKIIGPIDIPMVTKLLNTCKKHFNNQEICCELQRHLEMSGK